MRAALTRVALALALAIAWGAKSARADDRPPLVVVVVGSGEHFDSVRTSIEVLLRRLEVRAEFEARTSFDLEEIVTPGPEERVVLGRVWIDFSAPDQVMVYLADASWEHVLVRRVDAPAGLTAVVIEAVAQIVDVATGALRGGLVIGAERAIVRAQLLSETLPPLTAPTPETPVAPPVALPPSPPVSAPLAPRARQGLEARIAAGYEGAVWSAREVPTHGPMIAVGVAAPDVTGSPGLVLSGQLRFPAEISADPVGVRLEQIALRLVGQVRVWRWLEATAGAGLDVVGGGPRGASETSEITLRSSRTAFIPIARAMLAARTRLWHGLAVVGGVGTDVSLVRTGYIVDKDGDRIEAFDPWVVRPLVMLSIESSVLGGEAP